MLTNEEMIGLQAEKHDLVSVREFKSAEEYVLYLMHCYAYKVMSVFARGKVLDLGCNVGYGSLELAANGAQVFGVDVSEKAIDEAKKSHLQPGLSFSVIDGTKLPFPADYFDVVVSCQVIEHIVDVTNYLSEISRVLTRDGLVFFTTPNRKVRLDEDMKPWNTFHVTEYDAEGLAALLSPHFANIDVLGMSAKKPTYEIEFNRVQAALNANRQDKSESSINKQLKYAPTGIGTRLWALVRGSLKRVLPEKTIFIMKKLASKLEKNEEMLAERETQACTINYEKHLIEDFFYSKESIQSSLDFLAICSNCCETHDSVVTDIAKSPNIENNRKKIGV